MLSLTLVYFLTSPTWTQTTGSIFNPANCLPSIIVIHTWKSWAFKAFCDARRKSFIFATLQQLSFICILTYKILLDRDLPIEQEGEVRTLSSLSSPLPVPSPKKRRKTILQVEKKKKRKINLAHHCLKISTCIFEIKALFLTKFRNFPSWCQWFVHLFFDLFKLSTFRLYTLGI